MDMKMNEQTGRYGQMLPKNSALIRPEALDVLEIWHSKPVIDVRDDLIIVADLWSGTWVKWKPGAFRSARKIGRYTFIANPLAGDRCATKDRRDKIILWIETTFKEECL